ncbi:MAG: glycosyltransferase family 39 protein [bacterium]
MISDTRTNSNLSIKTDLFEILCLVGLFVLFLRFLYSAVQVYGIPYGIDFGEGYLADASLKIITGHNPYHPIQNPPWIVCSYPPLYPIINGILMFVFGPNLLPGRFIATASFLGILGLTILIFRKLGVGSTIAIISAGLLFAFPWPVRWAQVVRVDTLGIALALGGIYIWLRSEKKSDAILSAILFACAVFTKQSLLSAPIAVLIYAFLSRDRRKFIFILLFVAFVGVTYGISGILTGGGIFLHLFKYTANEYFLLRFTSGLGAYIKSTWILQVIALISFFMPGALAGYRRIFIAYYILAHLTLVTYGFEGSDTNYFIEPLIASIFLAGFAFDSLSRIPHKLQSAKGLPKPENIAPILLIALIIVSGFINSNDFRVHRINGDRLQSGLGLLRLATSAPGDILCEDASFTLLAGKKVIFQPYIMSLLYKKGKWDQSEFVQSIRDKKYSLIMLRVNLNTPKNTENASLGYEAAGFDRWTDEMEDAVRENYTIYDAYDVGISNPWFAYIPKFDPESLYENRPPEP